MSLAVHSYLKIKQATKDNQSGLLVLQNVGVLLAVARHKSLTFERRLGHCGVVHFEHFCGTCQLFGVNHAIIILI